MFAAVRFISRTPLRSFQRCWLHGSKVSSISAAYPIQPFSAHLELQQRLYCSSSANTASSPPKLEKRAFQAETKKLLNIVANALYSDKEIFLRELVSNASDAVEKVNYLLQQSPRLEGIDSGSIPAAEALEIRITTNDIDHTLVIEDSGIGMNHDEMVTNLGTIAKSGSEEFLSKLRHDNKEQSPSSAINTIIGQFGVGFYSSFMVSDKVEVLSRPYRPGYGTQPLLHWVSEGLADYEINEVPADSDDNTISLHGTRIILHLKKECREFSKEDLVEKILRKYSNFVGVPVFLNGKRINAMRPLWMKNPSEITDQEHDEFFRYIGGAPFDKPRYTLFYKTDAPLNIRALLYVGEYKPSMFDMSQEAMSGGTGVALYSRKVMIQHRNQSLLPKWLRFMRGIIDSEDIPLNLSRELLQDSALIRQLSRVMTGRIIKFFKDQAKRDPKKYAQFHEDFGLYVKEGIVSTSDQEVREDIARLLRFESSALLPGELTSLDEYCGRMRAGERNIYYICAKRRDLAEASPYYEAVKQKNPNAEVLFLFEPYDEMVLMQLNEFDRKHLKSVENELIQDSKQDETINPSATDSITQTEADKLIEWLKNDALQGRIHNAKITNRLSTHPCVVQVKEAAVIRHHLRTTLYKATPEERFRLMEPTLEINPTHPLIKHLVKLQHPINEESEVAVKDKQLARILAQQLLDNALVQAELLDDARAAVGNRLNDLLTQMAQRMV